MAAPVPMATEAKNFWKSAGLMRRVIDAEKDPVLAIQSMGNDRVQIAVEKAVDGFGQNPLRLRIGFEGLEIGPLGDVEGRCRQRPRPIDDVPIGIVEGNVAEIGQHAGFGLQHFVGFRLAIGCLNIQRKQCRKFASVRSRRRRCVGVVELLVEMTAEQQNRIFQLALVIGQRALAEFTGHHDGAERKSPQPARRRKGSATVPGRGSSWRRRRPKAAVRDMTYPHIVKQNSRIPHLPGDTHTMRKCHKHVRKSGLPKA